MSNQDSQVKIKGFVWDVEIRNKHGEVIHHNKETNLIPNEGLDFLIRAPFGLAASVEKFYLGLYRGNYIPKPTVTAEDIPLVIQEMQDYEEQERPLWDCTETGTGLLDNTASKAEFTITQDRRIYGAFLSSTNIKNSSVGLILSCVRFASPKDVTTGDVVRISGGIMYSTNNII